MNLNLLLPAEKINSIGYNKNQVFERPLTDIVDFDYKTILNAPPKNTDSSVYKELLIVSKSTLQRSVADVKTILKLDKNLDEPFIILLKRYNLKYPQNYIDLFYDNIYPILLNTKNYWNRARPEQLAKIYKIKIDIIKTDTINTPSYPSGHTAYSRLVANILKDLYPQIKTKDLDYIVLETAKARVMQGVHYPSDNRASLIFSDMVFNKLKNKIKGIFQ
jgi:hypothetical protein